MNVNWGGNDMAGWMGRVWKLLSSGRGNRGFPFKSRGLSLEEEEERGGGSHSSLEAGGACAGVRGRRHGRCMNRGYPRTNIRKPGAQGWRGSGFGSMVWI